MAIALDALAPARIDFQEARRDTMTSMGLPPMWVADDSVVEEAKAAQQQQQQEQMMAQGALAAAQVGQLMGQGMASQAGAIKTQAEAENVPTEMEIKKLAAMKPATKPQNKGTKK